MTRIVLSLFLLALPARAMACDYVQQFVGGYAVQQFVQPVYAQQFVQPYVQQFAVQAYSAPVVQQFAYPQQFVVRQRFAIRQRAIVVGRQGVVGRVLDNVFGRRRAAIIVH